MFIGHIRTYIRLFNINFFYLRFANVFYMFVHMHVCKYYYYMHMLPAAQLRLVVCGLYVFAKCLLSGVWAIIVHLHTFTCMCKCVRIIVLCTYISLTYKSTIFNWFLLAWFDCALRLINLKLTAGNWLNQFWK